MDRYKDIKAAGPTFIFTLFLHLSTQKSGYTKNWETSVNGGMDVKYGIATDLQWI